MSTNFANVYAAISRQYGDQYTITYAPPPSYLANIVGKGNRQKIVLVYKEERQKPRIEPDFISPSKLKPKTAADLDLTGSPLKDDCLVDAIADISLGLRIFEEHPWTPDEELHKGLQPDKARAIISSEDFQRGPSAEGHQLADGSVWFLCNASDYDKTLFMQFEYGREFNTRGMISFMGVQPVEALDAAALFLQHYELIAPDTHVDTHIENSYNIQPHISIRCAWINRTARPLLTNVSVGDVTLTQTFRLSRCGPLTQDYTNQISILKLIYDDIMAYKESSGAVDSSREPVYRCGRGINMDDLRERIVEVMTEINGFASMEGGSGSGAECDIESVLHRAHLRRLTDLTDKLWEMLKCCSSYKDLKLAFNMLFQCAARCNIVNIPTNKNRLAEIIREIANRRLAIPCLSGSEPLELLLEIGLEKLYKDYEYVFTEGKLCGADWLKCERSLDGSADQENAVPNVRKSLHAAVRPEVAASRKTLLHNTGLVNGKKDDAVGFKNSNFDEHESANALAKLLQIHCTLEHLLMANIHLNLTNVNNDICEQLLKKPLRFVEALDDSFTDKMEISLAAHEVQELLEGRVPFSRRITMDSQNKFRSVRSVFYYSMENICPPSISQAFKTEEKEMVKENVYFGWRYRKIAAKKFQ